MHFNINITENEAVLIDTALSLLHQNLTLQAGAIKENIAMYGEEQEDQEMLESAQELRKDVEELSEKISKVLSSNQQEDKLIKVKRMKRG